MLLATSFGELVLFWLIVSPLAFHGFRKMGRWFGDNGELLSKLNKWFNK